MELTRKQICTTVHISEGYSSDEMAKGLCISLQTVDSHRNAGLTKGGYRNC